MGVPEPGIVGGASSPQPTAQMNKTTSHFIELRVISLKAAVNEVTGARRNAMRRSTASPENG
jgi:hypothetical protein